MASVSLSSHSGIQQLEEDNQRAIKEYDDSKEIAFAVVDDIIIIGDNADFTDFAIALLSNEISTCTKILQKYQWKWPFGDRLNSDQIADLIVTCNSGGNIDQSGLLKIINSKSRRIRQTIVVKLIDLVEKIKTEVSMGKDAKGQRSKRGEHVINNGVVSVYKNIIESFLTKNFGTSWAASVRIEQNSSIYRAIHRTLSDSVTKNIQERLVVTIDDAYYINANALVYGTAIFIIREAAQAHMQAMYDTGNYQGSIYSMIIKHSITYLNDYDMYVDPTALRYWKAQRRDMNMYNEAHREVYQMFGKLYDRLGEWVIEIKRFSKQ